MIRMATTAVRSMLSLELSEKETKVLVKMGVEGAAARLMVLETGTCSVQETQHLTQEAEIALDILKKIADSLEGAEGKPAYVPKPDLLLFQPRK